MFDARIFLGLMALLVLGALSEFIKFFGLDLFTGIRVIGYLILLGLATYFVFVFLNQDLLPIEPLLAVALYAYFIPAYDFWSVAAIKLAGLYGYQTSQVMWYADGFYQFGIVFGILVGGYGMIYFIEKREG